MSKIFVSYRQKDTLMRAGRIADALGYHFGSGNLFQDRAKLHGGADWHKAIELALKDCLIMIVVIGPQWLTQQNADGSRRIDDEHDYVRMEVATALQNDDIAVIPVLVGGAQRLYKEQLPPSLAGLATIEPLVLEDEDWHGDMDKLLLSIKRCNYDPDKIGWKTFTSLAFSTVGLVVISPDHPDSSAVISTFILGTLAGAFALSSYYEFRFGPTKGKGWALGAVIFSGLLLLAGLGELTPD